ncbi:MAG: PilN domain-containing protein [Candidatus Omnitrophica bacterium]|nr:PilN domain-containing protein [Candidatus Omnitrophota bacterium]
MFAGNKLKESKEVLIIPRYLAALRFIELPSLDASEIKSMAEFQAIKEWPYAREEIVAGFRNIGSYKKGHSCIMLAIIKRQQIEEMIARRKARPDSIRLETELLYLHLLKKGIARRSKVSLIINIQKDYSEIMIIDGMRPVFSRGLSGQKTLSEEVNKSVISYKADRNNKEVEDAVIMHSLSLNTENIKACLEALFQIPINFYEDKLDLNILELPLEIDLLPKEYIDERFNKENTKQVFLTYFLLFIVIFMLASFFIFKIQEKNKTILVFSEKTEKMQEEVDQLNTFLKKTKLLKYREGEGKRVIDILKECCELVPQEIFLAGLDYDEKGILYCKGMSRNTGSIFNFIKVLEKSKYFKKVEVKYATKKEIGNQEFTDFNIGCFTY